MGNLAPSTGATPEQTAAATNSVDIKGKNIHIEAELELKENAKVIRTDSEIMTKIKAGKYIEINGGKVTDVKGSTAVRIN